MLKKIIIVTSVLCVCLLTGCAPDYVNKVPSNTTEILPMTQADTAFKLNKICTDVIASSGNLEQQMTKYLSGVVNSNYDDKKAILSSISTNLDITKENITEINSFRPADALSERKSEIYYTLVNVETYLLGLKEAVKNDDAAEMESSFNKYMSSINTLKTLSTGM